MKKKIVIFDLYDTVLKDISFNFKDGIKYLHTKYFSYTCTLEEFIDYADTFLPLYEKRNFAIAVYDNDGEIERYNVFKARMIIRHDADGKKYLYDVINIKKEPNTPLG